MIQDKIHKVSELLEQTLENVTASPESWRRFLLSSAHEPTAKEMVIFYGGEEWDGEETEIVEEYKMNARDLALWQKQNYQKPTEITGKSRPTR